MILERARDSLECEDIKLEPAAKSESFNCGKRLSACSNLFHCLEMSVDSDNLKESSLRDDAYLKNKMPLV